MDSIEEIENLRKNVGSIAVHTLLNIFVEDAISGLRGEMKSIRLLQSSCQRKSEVEAYGRDG